jgi:hypothetical protein
MAQQQQQQQQQLLTRDLQVPLQVLGALGAHGRSEVPSIRALLQFPGQDPPLTEGGGPRQNATHSPLIGESHWALPSGVGWQ